MYYIYVRTTGKKIECGNISCANNLIYVCKRMANFTPTFLFIYEVERYFVPNKGSTMMTTKGRKKKVYTLVDKST